jgi:hypothetical protein
MSVLKHNVVVSFEMSSRCDMKVRIRRRGLVCGRCRAIGVLAVHSGRDLSRWAADELIVDGGTTAV